MGVTSSSYISLGSIDSRIRESVGTDSRTLESRVLYDMRSVIHILAMNIVINPSIVADPQKNRTACSWRSKNPITSRLYIPSSDVTERKNNMIPVIREAHQEAFFVRIIAQRITRIGENIHRYCSQKRVIPMTERYFPAIDASAVARNMSTPSTRSMPHAMIFWSSVVMKERGLDFFLAMRGL